MSLVIRRPSWNRIALGCSAGFLAVAVLSSVGPALVALVGAAETGGVDLANRIAETQRLWSGESPYEHGGVGGDAVYPPASYVMLRPLTWCSAALAKWLWAGSSLCLLVALGWAAVKVSNTRTPEAMLLVALVPSSIAGVAYGIQNGQMHIHVVAALAASAWLLLRSKPTGTTDLLGGGLLLLALVKPTVSGPFLLLLLARRDRLRVFACVVVGYVLVTVLGVVLSEAGPGLISQWLFRAHGGARYGSGGSYGNLHAWSAMAGFSALDALATIAFLAVFLGFTLTRTAGNAVDGLAWSGLALSSLVARLAVYHQDYDDALLIGVQLGLFAHLAKSRSRFAIGALILLVLSQLPGRELLHLGGELPSVLEVVRVSIWVACAGLCLRTLRAADVVKTR